MCYTGGFYLTIFCLFVDFYMIFHVMFIIIAPKRTDRSPSCLSVERGEYRTLRRVSYNKREKRAITCGRAANVKLTRRILPPPPPLGFRKGVIVFL